jgi:hopanoid biosynthesis associated protein HpnK
MVGAPASADAVARMGRMPSLRVGLHLVLVEGTPLLPPTSVPDLVDSSGHFRNDMTLAGVKMFFSPRARVQLAAEINAQFEAFHATGLTLDHCNAHKHFHLHPGIANLMLRIGKRFGLRAARVPSEPPNVLAKVEPGSRVASDWVTAPWARLLRRRFRAAGVFAPDHVFGLRWSGQMTKNRLAGLIRNLPDGVSEIYLHPATKGGFAGSAPGNRYAEELAALLDPDVASAARVSSVRLGGFADFLKTENGGRQSQ